MGSSTILAIGVGIILLLTILYFVGQANKKDEPDNEGESQNTKKSEDKKSELPHKPTDWQCLSGIKVPIRREGNTARDVSCMALNGRDCLWSENCNAVLNKYKDSDDLNPLQCGKMHRSFFTHDGYSQRGHWCNIGLNKIE